jgi:hypothetical protein
MTPYDRFAYANPAFGAVCLHWVSQGYQEAASGRTNAPRLLCSAWGVVALALLAPSRVRERLPQRATGRLTNLLDANPEWRFALPDAIRAWIEPFWSGVRFGVATGVLSVSEARLRATGSVVRPEGSVDRDLRNRAVVFGKALAREGTDSAVALALGMTVIR